MVTWVAGPPVESFAVCLVLGMWAMKGCGGVKEVGGKVLANAIGNDKESVWSRDSPKKQIRKKGKLTGPLVPVAFAGVD